MLMQKIRYHGVLEGNFLNDPPEKFFNIHSKNTQNNTTKAQKHTGSKHLDLFMYMYMAKLYPLSSV